MQLNDIVSGAGGGASKDPNNATGSGQTVQTEPAPTLATATPGQVYWGPAAVTLASSATAFVLASKKKREEEEERKRREEARLRQIAYAKARQKRLKKASESALRKEFIAGGGRLDAPIEEIQRVLQNAHVAAATRAQQKLIDEQKQVMIAQQRQRQKMRDFARAEAEYDYYWTLRKESEEREKAELRERLQGAFDDAAYEEAVRSGEIDEGEEFRTQMRIKENREKMQGAFDDWEYEEALRAGKLDEVEIANMVMVAKASQLEIVEDKTWRDKTIEWVDEHQRGISLGLGVVAGVTAIILSGGAATPLVAAGWAALAAGGTVALGTVGLNSYFDRPLGYGLVRNVGMATGGAIITAMLPTIYAFGTQTVGLSAHMISTWLPTVFTNPIFTSLSKFLIQKAIPIVAPVVGGFWSLIFAGGVVTSLAGVSMNVDNTLSDEERDLGKDLATVGFTIATLSYLVAEVSKFANGAYLRSLKSRLYDPSLRSTTLGQIENLPKWVTNGTTNSLYGVPDYTWEGTNDPFIRRAYYNGDTFRLATPIRKISENRTTMDEIKLLYELFRETGRPPKLINFQGQPLDWNAIVEYFKLTH